MDTKITRCFVVFLLLWIGAGQIYAQTSATASWALTANQNAAVTGNVTAVAQQLSGLSIQIILQEGKGVYHLVVAGLCRAHRTVPGLCSL